MSSSKLRRGKSGSGGCKRRNPPYRTELIGEDAEQLAARFLEWYICQGLEGYKVRILAAQRVTLAAVLGEVAAPTLREQFVGAAGALNVHQQQ